MRVYLVSVRFPAARYIDSIWVSQDHAISRLNDLITELRRNGLKAGKDEPYNVWWSEATVADGELRDKQEEPEAARV